MSLNNQEAKHNEQLKYLVQDAMTQLGSRSELPETVWHYTTGDSLLKIIQSRTLFSTQLSCLNDSSEYRYSSDEITNAFRDLGLTSAWDEESRILFRQITGNLSDAHENPGYISSPYFVTCFSSQKDDLSQWRAYSGGENGYAIGFSARQLKKHPLFVRVNYDRQVHKTIAAKVAAKVLDIFREKFRAERPSFPDQWTKNFLLECGSWLNVLAPMIKDEAFQAEKEYRMIFQLTDEDVSCLEFRQKTTILSRHIPQSFTAYIEGQQKQLPINQIMVGPSRHKEVTKTSVEFLLLRHGYDLGSTPVTISKIPFQQL